MQRNSKQKRPLGRPMHTLVDHVNMHLREWLGAVTHRVNKPWGSTKGEISSACQATISFSKKYTAAGAVAVWNDSVW